MELASRALRLSSLERHSSGAKPPDSASHGVNAASDRWQHRTEAEDATGTTQDSWVSLSLSPEKRFSIKALSPPKSGIVSQPLGIEHCSGARGNPQLRSCHTHGVQSGRPPLWARLDSGTKRSVLEAFFG